MGLTEVRSTKPTGVDADAALSAVGYGRRERRHRGVPAGMRVLVIVPAYNEAGQIASVVTDIRKEAPWADVVVVDDGSHDGTATRAGSLGVEVLRLPFNLGVGGAMQTGYLFGYERGYDVTVQFDGDGQHRADQIVELVKAVEGGADLVVGSRLLGRVSYRFSPARWLGSRFLMAFIWGLTGRKILDPTSGFRAASAHMTGFFSQHYPQSYLGDTVEALVVASRHGMEIREVPARMRMTRRSSIGDVVGLFHTLRICLAILIDRIERRYPWETRGKERS